jgi:hypothetical protein
MREAHSTLTLRVPTLTVDWDASSKRPGFQSNLSAGTHMGVRNLAPTHVGSSKSYLSSNTTVSGGWAGLPGSTPGQ